MILCCLLEELDSHGKFAFKAMAVPSLSALKNYRSGIFLHIVCSCSIFTFCTCQVKVVLRPQALVLLNIETHV